MERRYFSKLFCSFILPIISLVAFAETKEHELLHAIANKQTRTATRLLKEGAPHTFEDAETGTTPLMKAVGKLNAELIKALIRGGAKAGYRTARGDTALHTAAYMASASVWEALIQDKPELNVTNASGATPMMIASTIGNVPVVKSLIKAKVKINAELPDGNTALLLAAMGEEKEKERRDVVLRLIRAGADSNHRNRERYNALFYAVANDDEKNGSYAD